MLLEKIDVQRIKQGVDLRDLISQDVQLRKESNTESHGPCPFCGGTDRFSVDREFCICRAGPGHCGFEGDAIKYVMARHKLGFKEACARIANGTVPTTTEMAVPVAKTEPKSNEFSTEYWIGQVRNGHLNLVNGKSTVTVLCHEYLKSRGIVDETIDAFKIGYRLTGLPGTEGKEKRPAITLPWYDRDDRLIAVKLRFTSTHEYTGKDNASRRENKTSRGNFVGSMFGWQAVKGPALRKILIITEGEINALSLWQAADGLADVLSCGTESMLKTLPDELLEYAKLYEYRLVWADKGELSEDTAIRINAASMRSPNNKDANDLLQLGKLHPLLEKMLRRMGVFDEKPKAVAQVPAPEPEDDEPFVMPGPLVQSSDPRPPLPNEFWVEGIQTFDDAWRLKMQFDQTYRVALGGQPGSYYLVGPIQYTGKQDKTATPDPVPATTPEGVAEEKVLYDQGKLF